MVRLKRRWILVRVESTMDVQERSSASSKAPKNHHRSSSNLLLDDDMDAKEPSWFPSKKELGRLIRDKLAECFGIAYSSPSETQVRWCHAPSRLALIRTPRDWYSKVRASLTLLTTITTATTESQPGRRRRICLQTLSVHGSTRTAQLAAIRNVRAVYRPAIQQSLVGSVKDKRQQEQQEQQQQQQQQQRGTNKTKTDRLCGELHDLLASIQALE